MIDLLSSPVGLAALAGGLAVGLVIYLLVSPRPVRIPVERRRPGVAVPPSLLERSASAATAVVGRILRRRGVPQGTSMLELAAVRMRLQDFVFLILVGSTAGFALGLVLSGPFLGFVLALIAPAFARVWVGMRISRRQKQFADQLDDSLVLMSSNLRAGHSFAQALNSVATETESPTAEEFSRVVNETRVGRPLVDSLRDTAARMESDDFQWVAQAIGINHEVGGNLAEVLDQVAGTIRQRNEIRRLVSTLSAEGRLSGIILVALPFVVTGFLLLTNPGYLAPFTESLLGYALIVLAVIMLIIGSLWMAKTVSIKF